MKTLQRAKAILDVEIKELQRVRRNLGAGFSQAVALILDCLNRGGKIVVTGVGKSYHIGQKISATLASTGSTSVVLHPSQALHGDIGIFCKHDVLLVLSYSGESGELVELVPIVKRQGGRIAAMTAGVDSALAKCSDAVITIAVGREACPFNLAPTASTTAMLAVGDALAIVLLEARGFRKEDFAKLHPGGAIGRTLLLRVSDIMRQGKRLAWVPAHARIHDAIVAMTGARSGSVGVVDRQRRVVGIFTDGDLRRMLSHQSRVLDQPIRKNMTPAPITIRDNARAVEALTLFEDHNIDDLLVVDAGRHLVGMVDIQDLPKFKIL
ncbi:MAG: KpsF/GutQ family sugar-phosphate isomerase [Verrucomicrobia bacterium]|nr:KpsF/GutQ family sugar-phosphate isomerase [Verrucomicrobiota bacterium]MCG2680835.1 KpsF/GutQ family sugar-phosphate isomerase [Kiritimatiellia bacterium]MBU4246845.1 KpsF/GutQ family sugar-phosphate isomerase [Verrucomicrobiota bacterium]MBU4290409.1 KpsF/GutQ family sugar-phosphate isomerase [Verrucomicrobiota bacterium]MBU4430260.1 KpsF/GutQ family sugar-phosphate isomerase [Verrucomicrobiota bacterium]